MRKFLQFFIVVVLVVAMPHTAGAGEQKSILISGASTGIGRNLAETLAAAVRSSKHQLASRPLFTTSTSRACTAQARRLRRW